MVTPQARSAIPLGGANTSPRARLLRSFNQAALPGGAEGALPSSEESWEVFAEARRRQRADMVSPCGDL